MGSIGVSKLKHHGAGPRLLRRGTLQAGAGALGGCCLQLVLQLVSQLLASVGKIACWVPLLL